MTQGENKPMAPPNSKSSLTPLLSIIRYPKHVSCDFSSISNLPHPEYDQMRKVRSVLGDRVAEGKATPCERRVFVEGNKKSFNDRQQAAHMADNVAAIDADRVKAFVAMARGNPTKDEQSEFKTKAKLKQFRPDAEDLVLDYRRKGARDPVKKQEAERLYAALLPYLPDKSKKKLAPPQ